MFVESLVLLKKVPLAFWREVAHSLALGTF